MALPEYLITPDLVIAEAPGLHRAKLETIRTQAWTVLGRRLEGDEVVRVYGLIRDGRTGHADRSGRRWDRSVQVLKRAGLVVYIKGTGWRCVDQGRG